MYVHLLLKPIICWGPLGLLPCLGTKMYFLMNSSSSVNSSISFFSPTAKYYLVVPTCIQISSVDNHLDCFCFQCFVFVFLLLQHSLVKPYLVPAENLLKGGTFKYWGWKDSQVYLGFNRKRMIWLISSPDLSHRKWRMMLLVPSVCHDVSASRFPVRMNFESHDSKHTWWSSTTPQNILPLVVWLDFVC